MKDVIVKVDHLSHRYAVQWAVQDISLEIPKKGIYGLLGSNGAGKSTLMNILCGVLKQTKGDVFVNGINTKENPLAAKCQIGFLPQQPPLYEELTVEEYLTHAATLRRMPEREIKQAVNNVLERCSITHFRDRVLKNLSGGYQQRVGIAQAIVHNPDLVVLDEPTNGLDPKQILEIRGLVKSIAEEHTVLLSTHILSEVQAVCDWIFMIEQGKLIFSGTVKDFDNSIVSNTLYAYFVDPPTVETLEAIEGVASVEDIGGQRFRLHFNGEARDVIGRVVDESVAREWRLQEIRQERSSLDAVFATLSRRAKMGNS